MTIRWGKFRHDLCDFVIKAFVVISNTFLYGQVVNVERQVRFPYLTFEH